VKRGSGGNVDRRVRIWRDGDTEKVWVRQANGADALWELWANSGMAER